ncbi:MAG: TonB-dependent receptor [Alphaproteobacteria bacterium]|nr:TonB-dependent receptor [Alphaproteobacteria bacterium]
MNLSKLLLHGVSAIALSASSAALAQSEEPDSRDGETVVVTAQKRQQAITDVGMSIQALSSNALKEAGITNPTELAKAVPGFSFNPSLYGTPIYTIRGIGFQESTLSASPTVTTYLNEVPIPFPAETLGVQLDLERLEVLKGPQGTLYGQNSTGGLLNFIAARPTDSLEAQARVEYGSFNTIDFEGSVSGPITDTLLARIALRANRADGWQHSYTRPSDRFGRKDFLDARVALDWTPTERLTVRFDVSGWRDRGETPAPQFWALYSDFGPYNGAPGLGPRGDYAGFRPNTNCDPNNPLVLGSLTLAPSPAFCDQKAKNKANSADWNPEQDFRRDNWFLFTSLRIDYKFNDDLTLSSLTSYQEYQRDEPLEQDGSAFENYHSLQVGDIKTWYQELRLAGSFGGKGTWMLGANYEKDKIFDQFTQQFRQSLAANTLGILPGLPTSAGLFETNFGLNHDLSDQSVETEAVFANAEYPILESLTLQAGIRYTENKRDYSGCGRDVGDGRAAAVFEVLQALFLTGNPYSPNHEDLNPGDCYTFGFSPGFDFSTLPKELTIKNLDEISNLSFGELRASLKENNVSWRVGLNWKATPDVLLYANVSEGYKSGSYPTLSHTSAPQMLPVTQESVLAYEIGMKGSFFDGMLDLNGAVFYYDYKDKQITGAFIDPIFGPLARLVNIPKSHVQGFELSAVLRPFEGLRIAPTVSYNKTEIDEYVGLDGRGIISDRSGDPFPQIPEWQVTVDAQYEFAVSDEWYGFVGGNLSFQDKRSGGFGDYPENDIPSFTTLDLRMGVENESWRFTVWGRNVTDEFYWLSSFRINDTVIRSVGMPATFGISIGYNFQ